MNKIYKIIIILVICLFVGNISANAEDLDGKDTNQVDTEDMVTVDTVDDVDDSMQRSLPESDKIIYQTHIQTYGWQDERVNGEMSGTQGEYKRLEGIKIRLDSSVSGDVEYLTHVQTYGWEKSYKKNGDMSGTQGEHKRLEAIKIRLTGEISEKYDVYYRVHSQTYGWLGWAKNGETAGTAGLSKRLEAIEIKLVDKNETIEDDKPCFVGQQKTLTYQSYIQNSGWQNPVNDSETSGTTGKQLKIRAVKINLGYSNEIGTIEYITKKKNGDWETTYKQSGEISGNINYDDGIEAIKIRLTDEMALKYDVYYRTHIQGYGWLGWAKNDEISGNLNLGLRVEAIEIKIVEKDTGEPTGDSYKEKDAFLKYQAHVQSIGTQDYVEEGQTAGTTGRRLRMEALKIELETSLSGDVEYQSYVQDVGWEETNKNSGEFTGTINNYRAIQLLKINLTGELGEKYDIYYRVHSEKYGWLGWAKNGEEAGADYYDIQAVEICLYLKIDSNKNLLSTSNHHVETGFYRQDGYTYYKDKNGNQATDWIHIMNTKYFFNSLGVMIGKNVRKVIDVSEHNGTIDWATVKSRGDVDGVIVRVSSLGLYREDAQLANNIAGLKQYNIPYGIYIYSYAEDYNEGKQYAEYTIEKIRKYSMNPTMGIYLDLESNGITSYMGPSQYDTVVSGYVDTMFNNGYGNLTSIYTYKNYADTSLNSSYIRPKITWIAQYSHFCTYSGSYIGWQYSSTERIPGINGDVDVSVWF